MGGCWVGGMVGYLVPLTVFSMAGSMVWKWVARRAVSSVEPLVVSSVAHVVGLKADLRGDLTAGMMADSSVAAKVALKAVALADLLAVK